MSSATTNDDEPSASLPLADSAAISEADRSTNVVFFDGVCGLCNCLVEFVLSRDRRGAIRFAPLQGETAKLRLKAESREPAILHAGENDTNPKRERGRALHGTL